MKTPIDCLKVRVKPCRRELVHVIGEWLPARGRRESRCAKLLPLNVDLGTLLAQGSVLVVVRDVLHERGPELRMLRPLEQDALKVGFHRLCEPMHLPARIAAVACGRTVREWGR